MNAGNAAKWKVYIHLNKVNGKTYVGITQTSVERRWGPKGYGYRTQPFYKAIEKYGWDNFEHIIFARNLTMEEAVKMESTLIIKLGSLISQNGYNISLGGEYSISNTRKVAKYNPYGKCIQVYNNIHEAARDVGLNESTIYDVCTRKFWAAGRYGWRFVDEYADSNFSNIESEFPREKYDRYYSVIQFDSNGSFIKKYRDVYSLPNEFLSDNVLACCRGHVKRSGGYAWAFEIDVPDIENFTPAKHNHHSTEKRKAVVQLTLDGKFVNRFNSAYEAGKILKISPSTIAQICRGNGRTKTSHGYTFEYEQNYMEGIHNKLPSNFSIPKRINKIDDGTIIETFNSLAAAARSVGLKKGLSISNVLNTGKVYHGYIWSTA